MEKVIDEDIKSRKDKIKASEKITRPIPKEKRWAKGLSQQEFEREWVRRHPGIDVIPAVREWLYFPLPKYHGINPVNPEDYQIGD